MLGPAKVSTTTTGTGNLTIAAVSGYPSLNDVAPSTVGRRFPYTIVDSSSPPLPIEGGIGYMSASTTMVRELILWTYASSTWTNQDGSPTAVSLASGTKYVLLADGSSQYVDRGGIPLSGTAGAIKGIWVPQFAAGTEANVSAKASNTLMLAPFVLLESVAVTGIGLNIVGVLASNSVELGVYDVQGNGYPATPIIDSGTNISTATAGFQAYSLATPVTLPPGRYYLALNTPSVATWTATGGKAALTTGNSWMGIVGATVRPTPFGYIGSVTAGTFPTNPSGNIIIETSGFNADTFPYVLLETA